MSNIPTLEKGEGLGVNFYLREKDGKQYLYMVVCENGECRQENIANVEALYAIARWFKDRGMRLDKRSVEKILKQVFQGNCPPCKCKGVEGRSPLWRRGRDLNPRGVSPTGLAGRRPGQARRPRRPINWSSTVVGL